MHSAQGDLCLRVTAGNDCSVHGAEVQDLYEVGELFSLKTDKKVLCYIYTGSVLLRPVILISNSSLMSL